jgi:LytS/YehU family sensor histidine kinase
MLVCAVKLGIDNLFLYGHTFPGMNTMGHFLSAIPYYAFFLLTAGLVKIISEFGERIRDYDRLQQAQTEAELKWLKSQINPHFLFNTLNNIHSLAYFKSDETPEMIVKLSELMRYQLEESKTGKVAIEKEIKHIENYIQLQCLKTKWKKKVRFNNELKRQGLLIESSILINFIENAFKHGNLDHETGWINIDVALVDQTFLFEITNTFQEMGTKDKTTGIGLANVERRLQLIYKDRYRLHITKDNDLFRVKLELPVDN